MSFKLILHMLGNRRCKKLLLIQHTSRPHTSPRLSFHVVKRRKPTRAILYIILIASMNSNFNRSQLARLWAGWKHETQATQLLGMGLLELLVLADCVGYDRSLRATRPRHSLVQLLGIYLDNLVPCLHLGCLSRRGMLPYEVS